MSIINRFFISIILILFPFTLIAEEVKKVGKFKDWETMVLKNLMVLFALHNQNLFFNRPKQIREILDYLFLLDLMIKL